MKKRMFQIISMLIFVLITGTACNKTAKGGGPLGFDVGKTIYDGSYISLSCQKILHNGIEFEVTNKSNEKISVDLTIGLDGTIVNLLGDASDWEVDANTTKICTMNGDIKYLEHKTMSLKGIVFVNSSDEENFDICDFDLGGSINIEKEYPAGESMYNNIMLAVDYIDADAQGINFKVTNNREESITIGFDSFIINHNKNEDYSYSVIYVPPHTVGIYSVDILSYNEDYFSSDLESFQGIMTTNIEGQGIVDRFPISYDSPNLSITYTTYMTVSTLTKEQLRKTSRGYSYKNRDLLPEDCEWIDTSWNKQGTVEHGAMYRIYAMYLEGFPIGNTYEKYAKDIIGFIPESRDEFKPYVDNASSFIVTESPLVPIIKKFESLNSVDGTFNFNNGKYEEFDFIINDVRKCAAEMQITEEMLGYILDELNIYGVSIEFNGNTCTCKSLASSTTSTTSTSPVISETDKDEPVPDSTTSNEISFGFLDYKMFDKYLTGGIFRCGSDFTPGDYYIFSLYGAEALYDVSDSPNDFSWSDYRVLRKVSVKKGQYVNIPSGGLLVACDEVNLNNLNQYGIFVVGRDLPEGDYKITSLTDIYRTELENIEGIRGAYQISEDNPENEPEDCDRLFNNQTYITVKNGQYITINNAKMVLSE